MIDPVLFKYKMPLLQQPNCQRSSAGPLSTGKRLTFCRWTEAESNAGEVGHWPREGPSFKEGPSSKSAPLSRATKPETGNLTDPAAPVKCKQISDFKTRTEAVLRRRLALGSSHFRDPTKFAVPSNASDFIEPRGFRKGPLKITAFRPQNRPPKSRRQRPVSPPRRQQKAPQARRFFRIVFTSTDRAADLSRPCEACRPRAQQPATIH